MAAIRTGHADDFDGMSAQIAGRVIDGGVGRALVAVRDQDGRVWVTTMNHAEPVYHEIPLSWSLAALLVRGYEINANVAMMRREGYPETFIHQYINGMWAEKRANLMEGWQIPESAASESS